MKVKIKKLHKDAVIPKRANPTDAGLDLTAVDYRLEEDFLLNHEGVIILHSNKYHEYDTGLSIEIPEGHVGLVFPRSSISKTEASLANSVGVIDAGYRGPVKLRFYGDEKPYNVGDRIGQIIIIPYPQVEFEEVEDLTETERGQGGFGSSGV